MTSNRATSLPLSLFTPPMRSTKYTTQNNKNPDERHKNAKSKRQEWKHKLNWPPALSLSSSNTTDWPSRFCGCRKADSSWIFWAAPVCDERSWIASTNPSLFHSESGPADYLQTLHQPTNVSTRAKTLRNRVYLALEALVTTPHI